MKAGGVADAANAGAGATYCATGCPWPHPLGGITELNSRVQQHSPAAPAPASALAFLQIAASVRKSAACAQNAKLSVNAQAALKPICLVSEVLFMGFS